MRYIAISKIIGLFLVLFSVSMLPPIAINAIYHQLSSKAFYIAFLVTLLSGLVLWLPFLKRRIEVKVREGFIIVVLFWVVLSLFGALPFILSPHPHLSFTDAFFESISGLTTTGASVIFHIDALPRSVLFYRQELQFIGGMGIIVLAVAILPMLGVGGMQLFRAETPGPIKDAKLTPRIQETAKTLWFIYIGLVVLCAFFYWLFGMNLFDAVGESFATISTGGFSMHDSSFGYYNNHLINSAGAVFMILGATNFALHFKVLRTRSIRLYFKDIEFKTFIWILFFISLITIIVLLINEYYLNPLDTVVNSIFNVVSLMTTTGFVSSSFAYWPTFLPILIMLIAIIGGCAASTSGGIKVMRLVLLAKQSNREMSRLIHPNGVFAIKFGKQVLPEYIVEAIWGFISIFFVLFSIFILLLMATGMDFETAFGSVVATLANAGAGIAGVSDSFEQIGDFSKWILVFAMLLGRLELFTILVLFSPQFWRK
ncbi:MAG: TrkH family potassium uptake protein [Gammaproteobacteria bacterium]